MASSSSSAAAANLLDCLKLLLLGAAAAPTALGPQGQRVPGGGHGVNFVAFRRRDEALDLLEGKIVLGGMLPLLLLLLALLQFPLLLLDGADEGLGGPQAWLLFRPSRLLLLLRLANSGR